MIINNCLNKKGMAKKINKPKKESKLPKLLIACIWLFSIGSILVLALALLIISFTDLPSLEELENPKSNLATEVITSDGVVLGQYFRQNRTNADFYELPDNLVNALVATEDERFYAHAGVDGEAIARAVAKMGKGGGGSTITQQLARMLTHVRSKNIFTAIKQKLGEWIIATRIERSYTKEEILAMYFNQYDFLNNAVGINSAARVYFNKKPIDLTIEESAMLVGMAKNSSLYNPIRRPELVLKRREVVLSQMKNNSFINQQKYDSLRVLPLGLNYTTVDHKTGAAPYLRETLRAEVSNILKSKDEKGKYLYFNKEKDRSYDMYTDGLRVYTTVDSRMQAYAEYAVKEHLGHELQGDLDKLLDRKNGAYSKRPPFNNHVSKEIVDQVLSQAKKQTMLYKKLVGKVCTVCERPGTRKKKIEGKLSYVCDFNHDHIEEVKTEKEIEEIFNTPVKTQVFDWKSEGYEKDTLISPMDKIKYHKRFLRSGLMSMDPRTGYIKAWVGGPNFKYFQYDMVKKGRRQVGSTFKPFVYATALTKGQEVISPCEKISNIEYCSDIEYNDKRSKQWCPKTGDKYDGLPITFKEALAGSMNNVTVEVINRVKPVRVIANVEKMGFKKGIIEPFPSMALGVFDLSVYEMVGAISTFANQGIYIEPIIISRIEDKKGNIIYQSKTETEQVFDPHTAYTTIQMMKGVVDGIYDPRRKTSKGGRVVHGTSIRLRGAKSGQRPYVGFKNPIAGKTGTTNNNTDGWFLGLTPELVTGVWTGCEDKAVHFNATYFGQGANMALPIWGYYMNKVYEDSTLNVSKGDFDRPENYIDIYNCNGESNTGPIDPNDIDFGNNW